MAVIRQHFYRQAKVIQVINDLEHVDREKLIQDIVNRQTHISSEFSAFITETKICGDAELLKLLKEIYRQDYGREAQRRHRQGDNI